jgi:hypothetical protein
VHEKGRRGRAIVAVLAGAGALSGAMVLKRRYDTLQATGSLRRDADLSGAPFGPALRPPPQPPTGNARVLPPPWEPPGLSALAAWIPAAPRSPAARAVAYAWAAPVTLAGLLLGLASGARPRLRDGVLVFAHAHGPAGALLRARGFRATALGHAIVSVDEPDDELMAHELVHVRHAERLGVFSALLYGLLYPLYGYSRHPMERAARTAARRLRGAP